MYKAEIYSRDVSGRELAVHKDNAIEEYPLYGLDMIGKLKNDIPYYYYKDHLGSVRAVVNATNDLVSAQDFDQWGYILQGRTYESDDSKFKFTAKERDQESFYDYFGARYYDAGVGRWGGEEPNVENYFGISPYCYSLNNPIIFKDVNGKDAIALIDEGKKQIRITVDIYYSTNLNFGGSFSGSKLGTLNKYINEANASWNQAGNKIEYKGKDYEVVYSFNLIAGYFSNQELMDIIENNPGANVALYDNYFVNENGKIKTNVPAGVSQNILYIYDPKGGEWTGSHELGHLMGLNHPAEFDGVYKDDFIDLMSYGKDKLGPRDWNVRLTIDGLNFKSTKNQIIKGALE